VLVHGGGCVVDEMLAQAGFTTRLDCGLSNGLFIFISFLTLIR